jgi:Large extracellular alpha-helical protein
MRKYGIVLIALFCICGNVTAQLNELLLIQKFNDYQTLWPKTNLQLIFNQTKYSPGDTAWFKAYFLKEDFSGVSGRQLIELNLLDSNGKTKLHFLFQVTNGIGYNQIAIPDMLPAGTYLITAHSNWMKNFDPSPIFKREIKIVRDQELINAEVSQAPLLSVEDEKYRLLFLPASKNHPAKIQLSSTTSSQFSDRIFVIVSARGQIWYSTTTMFSNANFVDLELPREKLPAGIIHISVLQQSGELLASRDFNNHLKNDKVQVAIKSDQSSYQTRDKVKIEVSLTDASGQPVEGEFSISVVNDSLFEEENLTLEQSDSNWVTSFNNFLITRTASLPWPDILAKKVKRPRFQFTNVIEKKGSVVFPESMKPVPDYTQVLLYLQKSNYYVQTFTSGNGRIGLTIPDFEGQDEFFYLATLDGNEIPNVKIKWDEEPISLPRSPASKETDKIDRYAAFNNQIRLIDRSYNAYAPVQMQESDPKKLIGSDFENEIAKADITINLQDYTIFPTMEELVKEVIPSIFHRKTKNGNMVRVHLLEPMRATADPLYIIDGIATKDTNFFLSINPIDVVTVKIVNSPRKLMPLGLLGKQGIIIVQTKKNDRRAILDDSTKLIEGLSRPLKFTAPDYSKNEDARKPNFRSTVYWNPIIKTGANGKALVEFFCSDDVGDLQIQIHGLTSSAIPFSVSKKLNVLLKK